MSNKLKVSDKCKNVEKVDGELVLSIKKLREIQDELKKVNEEESDKALEIQQTYNEIRKPMYDKRNDLINTIPNFWLTGFLLHPGLCGLLNKEDRNIFKYLRSLEVEDHKNVNSCYSIIFNFNLNPYFKDTKIVKTINFLEEGTTKVIATPIKWKEGKEYPNGVIQKKKGNKRHPSNSSFFSWFSDTELKKDEIAEIIKEDLWPKSLDYFYKEYLDETYEKNEADDMEKDDDDDDSDDVEKNDDN